jgi:predicted nucleic acid-binding protein
VNQLLLSRRSAETWLSDEEVAQFMGDLRVLVDLIEDAPLPSRRQTADPKDEFIVALARVADVVALISGDSHLIELADPDLAVLTPAVFLERLES